MPNKLVFSWLCLAMMMTPVSATEPSPVIKESVKQHLSQFMTNKLSEEITHQMGTALERDIKAAVESSIKRLLSSPTFQDILDDAVTEALKEVRINEQKKSKSVEKNEAKPESKANTKVVTYPKAVKSKKHLDLILKAEEQATPAAKKVLSMARKMVIDEQEVLPGGCWDYVDRVFMRAGFSRKARKHVFNGKYPKGPFVDVDNIRVGDWLYIVNHSYHDVQHSSLFVAWTDKKKKLGLMLSYAGENRREPARYRVYDLSHVYKIVRASEK